MKTNVDDAKKSVWQSNLDAAMERWMTEVPIINSRQTVKDTETETTIVDYVIVKNLPSVINIRWLAEELFKKNAWKGAATYRIGTMIANSQFLSAVTRREDGTWEVLAFINVLTDNATSIFITELVIKEEYKDLDIEEELIKAVMADPDLVTLPFRYIYKDLIGFLTEPELRIIQVERRPSIYADEEIPAVAGSNK